MLDRSTRYIRSVTPRPGLCLLMNLESGSTVTVSFKEELHAANTAR